MTPRLSRFLAVVALPVLSAACAAPRPPAEASASPAAERPIPEAGAWKNRWADGAVFYEIFVRSFRDTDGDGIGDLPGVTSKLDYLKDLGVEGIWLMPIFESPSYHGYDTTDYEAIEHDYGTLQDLEALLTAAHRRGIRVVVDFVMNHTSDQHPWFRESASSPRSPKRDWYVWRADDPGWTQPWGGGPTWHRRGDAYYFGLFWGGMPDLNFRNPAVRDEIERLARSWLDRGVDGFRLDATRHLIETGPGEAGECDTPETHRFLKEFSASVRASHPEALLVGENWTDTARIAAYYGSTARVAGGDELPMSFDFPLAGAIVSGVKDGDGARIAAQVAETRRVYPAGVMDATFLTNHDMMRVATQLGSDPRKARAAAAILLTLPGTPFLYYGEEIGLENAAGREDEAKRTPMPWDGTAGGGFTAGTPWEPFAPGKETANVAREDADAASLLSRYRAWARLRRDSAELRGGGFTVPAGAVPSQVLAFVRDADGGRVLVAHNLGASAADAGPLDAGAVTAIEAMLADPGAELARRADGKLTLRLPGGASAAWRLR